MIEQIILIAHLLIALGIIALIMLQQGKGAEMGASFGAGASQTLFGADGGGNVLTKATAVLVVAFFVTSFGLAIVAKNSAVAVDELDLPIPMLEDAPVVEGTDVPSMELPDDVPALESAAPVDFSTGDEIPSVE
jgi:preprotein translocase subunit SecG